MTLPHKISPGDDVSADPVEGNFEALDSTSSTLQTNMSTVWHLFDPITGHNHGGGSNSGGIVNHGIWENGSSSGLANLTDPNCHPQYVLKGSDTYVERLHIQPSIPYSDNTTIFDITTATPSSGNIFKVTYGGNVTVGGTDSTIKAGTGNFTEDIQLGGTTVFGDGTPTTVGTTQSAGVSDYLSREDHKHKLDNISNSNITVLSFDLGGTLTNTLVATAKSFTVPSYLNNSSILEVQHYLREFHTGCSTNIYDWNGPTRGTISTHLFIRDTETYVNTSPSIATLVGGHIITCNYEAADYNYDSSIIMILKTPHDIN